MGVRRIRLLELRREGRGKERHAMRSVIGMTELGRGEAEESIGLKWKDIMIFVLMLVSRNGYMNET